MIKTQLASFIYIYNVHVLGTYNVHIYNDIYSFIKVSGATIGPFNVSIWEHGECWPGCYNQFGSTDWYSHKLGMLPSALNYSII